jgi:hypothetical protein
MNGFLPLRRAVGAAVIAAALAVVAALAGCTQQPGHSEPAASRSAAVACQQIVAGTRQLTLRRLVTRNAFTPSFTWPAVLRSHNAADARAVARALCALPQLPAGVSLSGSGYLVTYLLTLSGAHGTLATVTFLPHASNGVSGLPGKQARLYSPHAALWALLGKAVGLPHATLATFAGKIPAFPRPSPS